MTTNVFAELRDLFQDLKKANFVEKTDDRSQESGDNASLSDDPTKAHFEAIFKYLEEVEPTISGEDEAFCKIVTMKASLIYEQAKLKLALEDNNGSQELLEKALEVVVAHKDDKQVAFLYFRIINHLAYLLSKNGNLTKAKDLLESVTKDQLKTGILVYSTEELFLNAEIDQSQAVNKLNKLIVNNLQMLGWVYGKLGFVDLHAQKQHDALQHQLKSTDCDLVLWACRCTRVSTLFLTSDQWVNARYHLAAAGAILDSLEGSLTPHPELGKAQADLARGWIYYGLQLFSVSKKNILERMYSSDEPNTSTEEEAHTESDIPTDACCYEFTGFTVPEIGVPAEQIKTTEQARSLFLHTHIWLKRVRVYYTLRDYPLQYVNAVLDLSELYRFLAFYEPDLDSQYNVQKRRADALETLSTILREIRPQCYVAVSVELLRELAEVQIELMGINLRRLYLAEGTPDNEDSIRRRMQAVSDIHSKLETVGDMLGHSTLDEQYVQDHDVGPANECATDQDEDTDRSA